MKKTTVIHVRVDENTDNLMRTTSSLIGLNHAETIEVALKCLSIQILKRNLSSEDFKKFFV